MPESTCVVDSCDRPIERTDKCGAHYQRLRRQGDVLAHIPIQANGIAGKPRRNGGETCAKGHPLTADNVFLDHGATPACRTCRRERSQGRSYSPDAARPKSPSHLARKAASEAARAEREATREARAVASLHRRVRERLVVSDETWNGTPHVLWTGAKVKGYGAVWDGVTGNNLRVHRVAWEMVNGPIPDGLTIDHLCRAPLCSAVDHLEPVTIGENVRRADPGAWQKAKTHCPRGHEYTEANTRVNRGRTGRRGRQCRACQREDAGRKYREQRSQGV